ncbi:nerve growth factor receptor b [Chanos chanos]|uniref:Nerve growth factor receptor b n=1 Tax=Chanos chanos TaxID=29144 RepID=A0A6J2VHT6_CHACN|nr:tumor necrosis factor receptor superfamily member 16-like [Chanos chanos]
MSGQYTTSGECCKECQPGEGVVQPCGDTQTVCEQCLDSETFSENFSHTEKCQPCTRCTGLLRMETPCTDTNDAVCVCDYGYFRSEVTGECQACTVCPEGQGVLIRCMHYRDTVCEECDEDTYSDQESALDPCLPCTACEESETMIQSCTSVSDTVCQGLNTPSTFGSPPPSPEEPLVTDMSDFPLDVSTERVTTADPGLKNLRNGLSEKLIPIYSSILAAVLLGLIAFVIFKWWNSCKQNKQGANNRAGTANPSQTPSPEGEKLHSDSGISVDSQSLQEGQGQPHTVVKMDGGSALSLPLHTREEVEKLLSHTCGGEGSGATEETDWCSLAGLLGYEEERIASFRQEERPIQALLSDWASQDSASVDTLCTALRKINREDIIQSISLKPTATSAV